MTIPASEDVNSAAGLLFAIVNDLQDLPHIRNLTEINALGDLLKEHKPFGTAQADSGLQHLHNALSNASRLAAKWGKARLRLLFEPLTFAKELCNAFRDIRQPFDQLQVPSTDQIVEQLDKVIVDLSDGGAYIELNSAEIEFKHQFFHFLRVNRSKSDTSEDAVSVGTWLAKQLGTDVDSIRQELQEMKENEGTFLEELIFYVTELEERKWTAVVVEGGAESCYEGGEEAPSFIYEGGETSSDANSEGYSFDKPLDEVARGGVQALGLTQMAWVLTGFDDLITCTKRPNGKLELFKAGAIPEAIRLAKVDKGKYTNEAMALLEALTSSRGGGDEGARVGENRDICLHISNHLDFLITLMNDKRHPEARLLAAETVVNMLVNSQVWRTVRTQHDIVSALVAISNEDAVDASLQYYQSRADRVCLVGLTHLTEFSSERKKMAVGDKQQIIVKALMKLLREGLSGAVLMNLAKDSLVALDTQILVTGTTKEVCLLLRSHLSELVTTPNGFMSHSTIPGRMAIISLMTKLCALYEDLITEDLFLYLLKMMKRTWSEVNALLRESSAGGKHLNPDVTPDVNPRVKELTKLLSLSVKLLWFCVTHGQAAAHSVLSRNVEERKTLEDMLEEQNSGILDESRLEILYILDQIDKQQSVSPALAAVGGVVAVLVKMAKSPSSSCRPQVASLLQKFVEEQEDVTEMQEAGGITALMDLMKEEDVNCQRDALLALHLLSSRGSPITTEELPLLIILGFLRPKWPSDVREAAVGLLDLIVKENAEMGPKFMETPEALKAMLHCLEKDAESPSSGKCASALLKMAIEADASVRLGIATAGLGTLVKFVRKHGTAEHKELLITTLGLLCESGNGCEEAVTKAGGHTFLLTSLEENVSKEAAAQGLLSLLRDVRTGGEVLQAGFVPTAMGSIYREFASTKMALGLASICSTPHGLDQIIASPRSVGALLILLERCPTLAGKGAAAAVIAKLYPRLDSKEDCQRQIAMTDACPHLIKYLDLDDRSQLKEFLKALAAFATAKKGRHRIHEERGQTPLIRYLKAEKNDTQVRDLVLKILAEMSSVFPEGVVKRDSSRFLNVFLENKIGELLCPLPALEEFNQNTESMKNLLILIRNLSLAGPAACSHLSGNGAVTMLLEVLQDHDSSLSAVTELAVKTLVKFMDEPSGKKQFLNRGGIKSLVAVLKLDAHRSSDVKSITTTILASVAQDSKTGKVACEAIFNCDILPALNAIMYDDGETSRTRWQAAVLMKLLATYGPTAKVCAAMCHAGSLYALDSLRHVEHCEEIANDVLKFVRGKNSECRRYLDSRSIKPK